MGGFETERRQLQTLAAFSVALIVAAGAVASSAADGMRPLAVVLVAAVAVAGLLTPSRIVGPLVGALAGIVYAGASPAIEAWSSVGVALSLILTGVAGGEVATRLASSGTEPEQPSRDEETDEPVARTQVIAGPAFRQALQLEIARARRYEHTVSLLMIGVEDWPMLVAQRGPIAARRRLAEVADAVRRVVRDIDTVSVYNPGLLTVLLPETALSGAAVVAEKVERVSREQGAMAIRVGAASYPDDAITCDELIREAEAALDLARLAQSNVVDRARLD